MFQNLVECLPPEVLASRMPSTYCRMTGDLDFYSQPVLEPSLTRLVKQHGKVVVMDLSQVKYLDAAALHLFFRLNETAKENGTRLLFLVSPFHRRIMRIVGLDRVLLIFESAGTAEPNDKIPLRLQGSFQALSPSRSRIAGSVWP